MKPIYQKYQIFWLLLENFTLGNNWLSAGHFCEKEVCMKHLGYQWLSYKGATRISDTVYDQLPESVIERKSFIAKSGHEYFKYRIKSNFSPLHIPMKYHKYLEEFRKTEMYKKYKQ